MISNPALAKALRLIQKHGKDGFYKGEIANAIVAKVKSGNGVMSLNDLAEFQSEWVEPVSTNYHGFDVFELPPPGQGFAALEMLNILEVCVPKLGFNLTSLGPVRSDVLAPDGRSEEARLFGSAREERRSEVRERAGCAAHLKGVRGDVVRTHQSERRRQARHQPAALKAARST